MLAAEVIVVVVVVVALAAAVVVVVMIVLGGGLRKGKARSGALECRLGPGLARHSRRGVAEKAPNAALFGDILLLKMLI